MASTDNERRPDDRVAEPAVDAASDLASTIRTFAASQLTALA
jgi:hypothetical protein